MEKKNNIKKRILNVAKEEFTAHGYKKVRTDALANMLGISKRTLYEHFQSKEELFEEVVDMELIKIEKKIKKILRKIDEEKNINFLDELKNIMRITSKASQFFSRDLYEDIIKYMPQLWKKILNFRESQTQLAFNKIFSLGQKQGYVKQEINENIAYLMHLFMIQNILDPKIIANLPLSTKDVSQNIMMIFLNGILTKKGRKEFSTK